MTDQYSRKYGGGEQSRNWNPPPQTDPPEPPPPPKEITVNHLVDTHPYSRDWYEPNTKCQATSCLMNNRRGECIVPSKCELDSTGKCKGYRKVERNGSN